VDAVLGAEAFYVEENDFDRSLGQVLDEVARLPRDELNRRGRALCAQVISEFDWTLGADRMAAFINGLPAKGSRASE